MLNLRLLFFAVLGLILSTIFCNDYAEAINLLPDSAYVSSYASVQKGYSLKMNHNSNFKHSDLTSWKLFTSPFSKSSEYFEQPTGIWLTGSSNDIAIVERSMAIANGKVPVFVIYFSPSINDLKPEQSEISTYLERNVQIATRIGKQNAIVILEPDLLCLNASYTRVALMNQNIVKQLVQIYKQHAPGSRIYIDAGHSNWHTPDKMARILKAAGIEMADGFSTNVSNFQLTENELKYAKSLSKILDNKRFVIDTGRNGNGPGQSRNGAPYWSDPLGVTVGNYPAVIADSNGLDAFLWIKPPGEADGSAAPAGSWHPELIDYVKTEYLSQN